MNAHASSRRHIDHRWLLVPLVLALIAALFGAPALASSHKNFVADFTPGEVAGGATETFTATLTNASPLQQLGSANITPPSGFTATDVKQLQVNGTPQGSAEINSRGVVELRNLSTPPNGTVTVDIKAEAACDPTRTYAWGVQAKQANNFRGAPGNDLDLDSAASNLTVDVEGGCAVALAFDTQPAHAAKNTAITSEAFKPAGEPVRVHAVDEKGLPAFFDGEITLKLGTNPSGATLVGLGPGNGGAVAKLTSVTDEDGGADFTGFGINLSGAGYTLRATSDPELDAVTSDGFNIYDDTCGQNQTCQASASTLDLGSTASGTGGQGGGALLVKLGEVPSQACAGDHTRLPDTTTVFGDNLKDKRLVFVVGKDYVNAQANSGAAHYQVCAEPLDEFSGFTDRDGKPVAFNSVRPVGLLPDCPPPGPPRNTCVESKFKTGAGDVVINVRWGSRLRVF